MYTIVLRPRAQRALDRLQKRDFDAVVKAVKKLAGAPRPRGMEKIRDTGLWRIRQGNYRIIYNIDNKSKMITVLRIGNRWEVYRAL